MYRASHLSTKVYRVDFKGATDRATAACITLADVAAKSGVSDSKVRRARMNLDSPEHRPPPENWEKAIAKLARERAGELLKLAEELEA